MRALFKALLVTLVVAAMWTGAYVLLDLILFRLIGSAPVPIWIWAILGLLVSAWRVSVYAHKEGLFK